MENLKCFKKDVLCHLWPSSIGANGAAENGHLHILKWMASLNPPVTPNYFGADLAAGNSHLCILERMAGLVPPIHPN